MGDEWDGFFSRDDEHETDAREQWDDAISHGSNGYTVPRKKLTQAAAKKRADVVFSKIVRAEGRCRNCGITDNLQCAHVIGRGYAHTRTDFANAFCLCAGCHMRFHRQPDEWMDFVDAQIGRTEYQRLKRKAIDGVGVKFDWVAELEKLKAVVW